MDYSRNVYDIFWIDVYSKGYRKGASHAVDSNGKPLCGLNFHGREIDGGYQTTEKLMPECKTCLKIISLKNQSSI